MTKPTPPPSEALRRAAPPGFRPSDLILGAVPDTREAVERSLTPKSRAALDELLRLRQRPQGARR